ncbi:hypothetical protein [Bosea sp. CS1GBMeth4]|uniref:hypothetical protein n=1 Tax=Bosea sp. CS1GBMeth4 TaxID=1892849 RepID=UPI001648BBDA|nr:hypothetical protein [Bosea sp. CS1GBMeth4]
MTAAARTWRSLGWLAGPVLWAAVFLAAYASEALVCTRLERPGWHGAIVAAAGCIAILLIAARLCRTARRSEETAGRFLARTGATLDWLSLVAIGWTISAALLLPACAV